MIFDLITVIKNNIQEIGLFFFLLSLTVLILIKRRKERRVRTEITISTEEASGSHRRKGEFKLTIIKQKSRFRLKQKESI